MKKFQVKQVAVVLIAALVLSSCKKETTSINPLENGSQTINKKHGNDDAIAVSVFATGLNNPRGLKFGPDGYLYVAEAGDGGGANAAIGDCGDQVPFPVGPYYGGPTGGRVTKIKYNGDKTIITSSLPSSRANEIIGGDVEGVSDVAFIGNQLYALLAGAGCSHGNSGKPNGIYKINQNGTWSVFADISAWLKANPVKNPEEDDFEPDGTPYNMVVVRGDFYVIEPNHGDFIKVNSAGKITRVVDVSASQGHIVPTALTYKGNFFVGNLHPFPIVPGSSKILKITPSGELKDWATGFTTILGLTFDEEDNLYVLENTTVPGFPTPATGDVVRVSPNGTRKIIASGLNLPTGIAFGPDENLYVSGTGFGPFAIGGGQVLKIALHD